MLQLYTPLLKGQELEEKADRLQEREEKLADVADRLDKQQDSILKVDVPYIKSRMEIIESRIALKVKEIQEEEVIIQIHRNSAQIWADAELHNREQGNSKLQDSEKKSKNAEALCLKWLPMRAAGFFAKANPKLKIAGDLEQQSQTLKEEGDIHIRTADLSLENRNVLLNRLIVFDNKMKRNLQLLERSKKQLKRKKLALLRNVRIGNRKRTKCHKLRDKEYRLGIQSINVRDKGEKKIEKADNLVKTAKNIFQHIGQNIVLPI